MHLLDKLEFDGQWPLTMRARCCAFRYCPDPLGIVTAEQLGKLEFGNLFQQIIFFNSNCFKVNKNPKTINVCKCKVFKISS